METEEIQGILETGQGRLMIVIVRRVLKGLRLLEKVPVPSSRFG